MQRVGGAGADFACGAWCDRRDDRVDCLESIFEILTDERADFLGAAVVSVVVARGQHMGAEDDAAFHFGSESFFARFAVEVGDVGWLLGAMTVADAIEAREVG